MLKLCNVVGQPLQAQELQEPPVAGPAALPDASTAGAAAAAAGGELAVAGQADYTFVWSELGHHHMGWIQEQSCVMWAWRATMRFRLHGCS